MNKYIGWPQDSNGNLIKWDKLTKKQQLKASQAVIDKLVKEGKTYEVKPGVYRNMRESQ